MWDIILSAKLRSGEKRLFIFTMGLYQDYIYRDYRAIGNIDQTRKKHTMSKHKNWKNAQQNECRIE